MKKVLKGLGILLLVIVLLLVSLPFLFKGEIAEMIQKQMDENLNASVELSDLDLSLISTFPDFKLQIEGIKVTGKGAYEGVQLANIGLIETKLDLMSVINGEQIKVKSFGIADASFHVIVDVNGSDTLANYDIVKSSGETEETSTEEAEESSEGEAAAPFSLTVQNYYLKNIDVIYDDRVGDMYAEIKQFSHEGNGDFTQDVFLLTTQTNIEALTFKMEGIRYLKRAKFDVKFDTEIDNANAKYTFKENHFGINDLMLHFDGFVALPDEETTELDLTFNTEKTTFKSVLSLVPAVYMKDFESVKTSGEFALNGMAKGKLVGDQLPAFNLDLNVNNGRFQYPDLPKSADNINIALNVKNPGGSDDNTVVNLKRFHVELAENPIDMRMLVKTPVSDANIDGNIKMDLDLASIADVIPAENGEEYKGTVKADINLKGQVSTLEKEDYENFDANGSMVLTDILYNDTSLGYPVKLNKADFRFTPQAIDMAELNCLIGKSDISGNGSIKNYLPYYFNESLLTGVMNISSNYLDLNELAGEEETSTETESAATNSETPTEEAPADSTGEPVEVPGNIDFVLTSNFKKVLYDNIEMTEMIGEITVRDQKVAMNNLAMNMMDGKLNMNGFYETTNLERPTIDFKLGIERFDLPKTFETFNTIEKMAPIAENATGAFSTSMTLTCVLDQNMEPITETMNGGGDLLTHMVKISNSDALNKIGDALKNNDLKELVLDDVNISYEFRDGRVWVEPFDMKLGDLNANISGSNGFDQTLDYLIKTAVPTSALGAGASVAQGLLDQFNQQTGANASMGDEIKVDLKVTGTTDDPKILPAFGSGSKDATTKAKDELKKKAKEEADRLKKEAEARAREEADKLKKEAEAKAREEADKLKKEAEAKAKAEADRLKKEAEAKAKAEADRLKKKAEEDLKKKAEDGLKGLFKK